MRVLESMASVCVPFSSSKMLRKGHTGEAARTVSERWIRYVGMEKFEVTIYLQY